MQSPTSCGLKTEDEIELEAQSKSGISSFFRIARVERKMFWIMTTMFFIISFIYSVGRVLKEGAVLSRQLPLSINFLKTFVILPVTLVCVGLIQRATMHYSLTKIFDVTLLTFATLYILLGLVLLPFQEYIQINEFYFKDIFSDGKAKLRGYDAFLSLALIFNEWTSSLVYIVSELFGNIILSYLFLTFANSLNTPYQSARFTPLFYIFSNIALLLSSIVTNAFSSYRKHLTFAGAENIYNAFFVGSGVLVLIIYLLKRYLETSVTNNPIFIPKSVKKKSKKVKVGFMEGIKEMMASKLLLNISLTVMFYGISTNLIESTFKNGLVKGAEIANEDKKNFSMIYNSREQALVAISVIILLLSPFPRLIYTKGWIYVAIVAPIVSLISCAGVCGLAFYNFPATNNEKSLILNGLCASQGNHVMWLENILGCICVGLMKIAKYGSFDICKEAIAMQIDSALRPRYKGIFDGVFGKLGKSMGSGLVTGLQTISGANDFRKLAPICLVILILFVVVWIYSVIYLNRKYHEAVDNNQPIDVDLFDKKNSTVKEYSKIEQTVQAI